MEAGERDQLERDCAGGFHSTSLMKAARNDQPELVEKALECTANNIDAVGSDGRTALMIAAALGHPRVVRALCNAGADLSLVDAEGRSALDAAIRSEHAEIAALLSKEAASREALWAAINGVSGEQKPMDAGPPAMPAGLAEMLAQAGGSMPPASREAPF